jgi:protein disulfide-isomerase A1
MNKQLLPPVSELTQTTFEGFSMSDKVVAIAFFDKDDKATNETFTKVASALREEFLFGATNDAALAEKHGVKVPGLAVFKTFDEGKDVHEGALDEASITSFVKSAAIPLLGEIGPETYQGYMSSGIPLLYLFVEEDDEKTAISEWLSKIAKEVKGKLNIATIDAKQFGGHAANLNLKEEWPAIAIQNTETQEKYPFPQDEKMTARSVAQYVKDYLSGKLSPSIKSQEIPTEQPDNVYTVVQKTFNEIVHDEERDVLVEYYAPWCGHCKNLAPIYEKLAGEYKGASDKVRIVKIDASNNDTPGEDIKGFPTLRLYPAGKNKKGIEYEGDRSIESLRAFIKKNGTHGVDAVIGEEGDDSATATQGAAAKAASMAAKVVEKVAEAVGDDGLEDELKDEL